MCGLQNEDGHLVFNPGASLAVEIPAKLLIANASSNDGAATINVAKTMNMMVEQMAAMQKEMVGMKDDLLAANVKIVGLTDENTELKTVTIAMGEDHTALKTRVDDLEAAAAGSSSDDVFASELAGVKANVTKLDDSVAALQSDIVELNSTIANDVAEQEDGTFLAGPGLCAILGPQILALGGDPEKPCVLPTEIKGGNTLTLDNQLSWLTWAPLLIGVKKMYGIQIKGQYQLKSLAGLFPRLEEVTASITIEGNPNLESIDGAFPLLRKVGRISIYQNTDLTSLAGGFPALTTIENDVSIYSNQALVSAGQGDSHVFASLEPKSISQLTFADNGGCCGNTNLNAFCKTAEKNLCGLAASFNPSSAKYSAKSCCQ